MQEDILAVIKRGLEVDDKFKAEIFSSGEGALKVLRDLILVNITILILTDIRMAENEWF